ncbi:MAG: TetR/AcrR family transcriptional regulator [Chitinophagaceae bacterium]|nr:MAG: TetR/AcrR family transcriptional regulator [Chitinophagaceae bacterium]
MGTTERKQRQKEEVYDSILAAAWKLVKDEGWQGLSIRKIAEAIEYSVPVIYDHFANKEAILAEFTKQGFSELNEILLEAALSVEEPAESLRAISVAYWKFGREHTEYYQLMYGMGMPSCETVSSMTELQDLTSILQRAIERVLRLSGPGEQNSFVKMKSLWSMLHGLVSIQLMKNAESDDESDKEVVDESIKNFIAALNS